MIIIDRQSILARMIQNIDLSVSRATELIRAIVDTAIDAILIIDQTGKIRMTNDATSALLGYESDEMLNKNVNMLMPEPHAAAHDSYMARYLTSGNPRIIGIGREVEAQHKSGHLVPVLLAVSEVRFDDAIYFAGFLHDLTSMKEAESRIVRMNAQLEDKVRDRTDKLQGAISELSRNKELLEEEVRERRKIETDLVQSRMELEAALAKEQELGEMKSRFVSMASHEFRTPLSTILSSVALLKRYRRTDDQPQREKHINRIKVAVAHLNSVLNDILSISRMEEGRIEVLREPVSVQTLVSEVVDEVKGLKKPGQEFKLRLSEGPQVVTDRMILKNVLFNLVSNAIKYSGEHDEIQILLDYYEEQLKIAITDQGIGIPKRDQEYLFTRFYRATNATNIEGTGLGLHIVAGYLELLGGEIEFQSKLNQGSTFKIFLPK